MKIVSIIFLMLSVSLVTNVYAVDIDPEFEKIQIELDGGDIAKIPVREDPGQGAEVVLEKIHSKLITVSRDDVTFKWTTLGYGASTHKVLIPQLAAHTLFNHRNPGEDAPCLRSNKRRIGNVVLPPLPGLPTEPVKEEESSRLFDEDFNIDITISNKYLMNRERNICKVHMVEDVRTVIAGEEFYHTYEKDMGFRYIGDCPAD